MDREQQDQPKFLYELKESFLMLRCYDGFSDEHHNAEGENEAPAIPLSQLEERWSNPRFEMVTSLVLDFCGYRDNSIHQSTAHWKRLCQLIQSLPSLETFRCEGLADDAKFATLLQHVSSHTLKQFHMERIQCDLPRTFAQIGKFSSLQSLKLSETFGSFGEVHYPQSNRSFQMLANSLEQLRHKQLQEIYIQDWNCSRQAWKPVIQSIRSNFHLTRVHIDEFGCGCPDNSTDTDDSDSSYSKCPETMAMKEQSVCGYQLGKEEWESLQNGPRMHRIREQLQLSSSNLYDGKLEPWVEAMISCHELPLDCFHFFLSQLPPETYLNSDYWDSNAHSKQEQPQQPQSSMKKRKESLVETHINTSGFQKKAKCSEKWMESNSSQLEKSVAVGVSSHQSLTSLLLLLSSGGCSLAKPMQLSSFFSNTWRF